MKGNKFSYEVKEAAADIGAIVWHCFEEGSSSSLKQTGDPAETTRFYLQTWNMAKHLAIVAIANH